MTITDLSSSLLGRGGGIRSTEVGMSLVTPEHCCHVRIEAAERKTEATR